MKTLSLATALLLVVACGEPPAAPANSGMPTFATGGAAACPTPAGLVVTDEASLLAALAGASPGDVIAIDGFFQVTADVVITTDDITLTCATRGSGLAAQAGAGVFFILEVLSKRVVVDRLLLDASATTDGPYFAFNDGLTAFAEDVRLTNNSVTCGPGECAFFAGTKGAVVADNYFESAGSVTGVHLQGAGPGISIRTDGSRIERNTIVATSPSTVPGFGGIRPRDGSNVVVAHNVVIGPWANSLSPARLSNGVIEGNRLEGAAIYGMRMSFNPTVPISVTDNVIRNNQVTGAASAGVFAFRACGNVFIGNNLQGNAGNLGLIFHALSGANTLVGNQNVVIDNGARDCNGDGANDPNIITGRGAVLHGVNLGAVVSEAAVTSNGLR